MARSWLESNQTIEYLKIQSISVIVVQESYSKTGMNVEVGKLADPTH